MDYPLNVNNRDKQLAEDFVTFIDNKVYDEDDVVEHLSDPTYGLSLIFSDIRNNGNEVTLQNYLEICAEMYPFSDSNIHSDWYVEFLESKGFTSEILPNDSLFNLARHVM